MWILAEAFTAVVDETSEPVVANRDPNPRGTVAIQIGADRLAVMAEVTSDRGDRPAPPAERVRVHIILLCEHGTGLPLVGVSSQTASLREPHPNGRDLNRWGTSMSNSGEIHPSAINATSRAPAGVVRRPTRPETPSNRP